MAFRRPAMPHRSELISVLGPGTRVLCWAAGPHGEIVAVTPGSLAAYRDGSWQVWGWETVMRGGWNANDRALTWATRDENYACQLTEPGELPGAFRERVQASTVMTVSYDLDRGAVQLVARRSLGGDGAVTWLASASGGASLEDPRVAAFVVTQTDLLRAEYGL